MKKILITGCNGQLGRALRAQYKTEDVELVLTDVAESETNVALDITNLDETLHIVRREKPDVIINCAAHTNVDKCETEQDLAYQINAVGPRNLSIAAKEADAKLVHVSTDYVFAGDGTKPYTEFDTPHPVSAYGRTKLAGEEFVRQFGGKYFILRTAWLYGDGKNFVKTMLSLSEKYGEVNVVRDQLGSPTSAMELARLVHHLEKGENYGLFHATCEGSCSWADFAEEIFALAGKKTKVNRVTSAEYKKINPAAADRPAYSVLDNYMLRLTDNFCMAHWKDALAEYFVK